MMIRFIFFLILFPSAYFSQKYILLDSLKGKCKVNEYTLKTKDLYRIDKKISLYNVYLSKNDILLFSVLPSSNNEAIKSGLIDYNKLSKIIGEAKNNKVEKEDFDWKKITYDDLKGKLISTTDVYRQVFDWSENNLPENKTFEYQLVKKVGNDYYVAQNCFTELYHINNLQYPLIAPFGTINIEEQKVSVREMEQIFKKKYPKEIFPLDLWEARGIKNVPVDYVIKYYISKEFKLKNEQAYQFWTMIGWWGTDNDRRERGIDRFVYVPEKGIVGGSFDFYFNNYRFFQTAPTILWGNVLNEKVMIAEELNKP